MNPANQYSTQSFRKIVCTVVSLAILTALGHSRKNPSPTTTDLPQFTINYVLISSVALLTWNGQAP
jgi:hypothetical protein